MEYGQGRASGLGSGKTKYEHFPETAVDIGTPPEDERIHEKIEAGAYIGHDGLFIAWAAFHPPGRPYAQAVKQHAAMLRQGRGQEREPAEGCFHGMPPFASRGLMRGDFVFFNTMGRPYSHMGIFVGNGQFVHAPSTGGTVQRVRMDNVYFAKRFTEARSIFA